MKDSSGTSLKFYAWILVVGWTIAVTTSLAWNIFVIRDNLYRAARVEARTSFNRDFMYRRWAAGHGGVYVPVTESTPPNPYLKVAEREITTPSGQLLTLMNAAYVMRQVHSLSKDSNGCSSHITSLVPLNPDNVPDEWETLALKSFHRGEEEMYSITSIDGEKHMRLMRPMFIEDTCLKCHDKEVYKVGDVRGGISVTVPLAPFNTVLRRDIIPVLLGHAILWFLGLCGIGLGASRIMSDMRKRKDIEAKYEDLYDNAPDMFASVDAKTAKIVNCNQALAEKTGYTKDEIIGQPIVGMYHPDSLEGAKNAFHLFVTTGKVHNKELQLKRKDGTKIDVVLNVSAVRDAQGNILSSRSVWHDITERKKLEAALAEAKDRAEKASAVKDQFLTSMSHEIRTPMNSVIGYVDILEKTQLNADQKKYLNFIKKSGKLLVDMIDDILDFSAIGEGNIQLENKNVDLKENIEELVDISKIQAKEKGIEIYSECDKNLPDRLDVDPRRLKLVLMNLINNAIKFTEKGTIGVISKLNDEQGMIEISVKDTGIGILETEQENIFKLFTKTGRVVENNVRGVGLGLFVVKRVVEAMGGIIKVQSEVGKGSVFTVLLPVSGCGKTEPGKSKKKHSLKDLRILEVEDDKMCSQLVCMMLDSLGVKVDTAFSGEEALEKIKKETYDLVFMDVRLLGLDGIETTKIIRREISKNLPIIAISAYAIGETEEKCFAAGMNDFYTKPIEEETIEKILLKYCI